MAKLTTLNYEQAHQITKQKTVVDGVTVEKDVPVWNIVGSRWVDGVQVYDCEKIEEVKDVKKK